MGVSKVLWQLGEPITHTYHFESHKLSSTPIPGAQRPSETRPRTHTGVGGPELFVVCPQLSPSRRGLCSPCSSGHCRVRLRTRSWRGRQATQRTVGVRGTGQAPTPQPPTPRDAKNEGTKTEEHPCSFCCLRILRFPGSLLGARGPTVSQPVTKWYLC